ncbi:MAG TPA: PKD domain-containing protein [Vicinamibacterales bacterium]|nr:PKD domain-containing protein [Vicinamibacterales bacterium]
MQVTGTDALGDTTTATTSITVAPRPQPIVAITSAPSTGIQANTPVTFTATVTQGTTGATTQSVTWSFSDDGSTFTLQGNSLSVVHIFAKDGIYVVTATVTDSTGATGTSQLPVVVGNGGVPGANFTVAPAAPKVNQTVSFDATSSSGNIVNYAFDFGDGTLGQSGSSPFSTHVFTTAGTFNVRLTVTDSSGRSFTKTTPVTVTN